MESIFYTHVPLSVRHGTSYASYLSCLVTQVHPVRRGKVHRLRHAVATAHFRDKGTWEADHKLSAPLDRTVNLDTFTAQHLWRDLEEMEVIHILELPWLQRKTENAGNFNV